MAKLNPIGIEDFKSLKEKCYYVDKTNLINFISNLPDTTVCLFTRPRRFGKSLALSMLEYFFSNKYNSKHLFYDTHIATTTEFETINTMNVIHINLKNVDASNYENFLYTFNNIVANEYSNHISPKDYQDLNESDLVFINNITSMRAKEVEIKISLEKLIQIIYSITNIPSLVLIDEYDAPLNSAYKNGFFEKANEFMKLFLGSALKGEKHLWKAVLTGVTQIAHSSALSDLNNLKVFNVLNSHDKEFFGFTQDEIVDLLSYFGYKGDFNSIKNYYGGYLLSMDNIYNPWSILSFISNGFIFKNYWSNTGSYDLLRESILQINTNDTDDLKKLLYGESRFVNLDETINLNNNNYLSQTYTLLVFSGYLTSELVIEPNTYLVKIPNEEIKMTFKSEILNCLVISDNLSHLFEFKNSLINGNIEKIDEYFKKYILNSFSYYDLNTEKNYQVMTTTILAVLFNDAIVKSEVNAGTGRCDIYVRMKNGTYSFIFEIKQLKGRRSFDELKKSSLNAIKQIKDKLYFEEAIRDKTKRVLLYGMSFCSNNIVSSFEEISK